jgi:hypothetical protein
MIRRAGSSCLSCVSYATAGLCFWSPYALQFRGRSSSLPLSSLLLDVSFGLRRPSVWPSIRLILWPWCAPPKFYVVLLGVVIVVRLVFAQYWMWGEEHDSRIRAQEQLTELSGPVITPAQERLLVLIAKYQGQFVANKLIIGRKGNLLFDGQPDKGKDINLIVDLYDGDSPAAQQNFEALMDSIPLEYLRFFSEMRWDSPFVVSVTVRGMSYLRGLQTAS